MTFSCWDLLSMMDAILDQLLDTILARGVVRSGPKSKTLCWRHGWGFLTRNLLDTVIAHEARGLGEGQRVGDGN